MWQPIETAPRDGTPIQVQRVYQGEIIYDGPARWRTVHFPASPPDPLGRPALPEDAAYDDTGWMHPEIDKRVPEPTHWQAS